MGEPTLAGWVPPTEAELALVGRAVTERRLECVPRSRMLGKYAVQEDLGSDVRDRSRCSARNSPALQGLERSSVQLAEVLTRMEDSVRAVMQLDVLRDTSSRSCGRRGPEHGGQVRQHGAEVVRGILRVPGRDGQVTEEVHLWVIGREGRGSQGNLRG